MKIIRALYNPNQFNSNGVVKISSEPNNALTLENGFIKLKDVEKSASPNTPGDGVYGAVDEKIQTLRLNTSVSRKQSGEIASVEGVNVTLLMNAFKSAAQPVTDGGNNS